MTTNTRNKSDLRLDTCSSRSDKTIEAVTKLLYYYKLMLSKNNMVLYKKNDLL